jgi:hypothetical protein
VKEISKNKLGIDNFGLDPNLKDGMTGSEMTLEEEFQALVEACHIRWKFLVFHGNGNLVSL